MGKDTDKGFTASECGRPECIACKRDFRVDTFRAGGKGGQHQNKTDSGVRITHIPTGFTAECRDTRSQPTNKKRAFEKLAPRIVEWWKRNNSEEKTDLPEKTVIRTYNEVDNRVKDHETKDSYSYKGLLDNPEKMIRERFIKKSVDKTEE